VADGQLLQVAVIAGSALGGLGLFLLAVRMITDGLKVAAGHNLRDILGRWTRTPMHGIFAGVGITALVQSSSAVTVATIGFVNAGLLTLYQALGVIYGANVGTTMTGWLVAAMGFEFKLELFALPMIGLGMGLRILGSDSRRGALGEALAGFGLFFIGLGVLKTAFEGMSGYLSPQGIGDTAWWGPVLYVLLGFLVTLVTQSSSAAIAITLTAASGGILSLSSAAAMVIGANVGTTSTAMLSVIGATPNAKRVAAAHLLFNLLTGGVALLLLPLMLWLVHITGEALRLQDAPAVLLALFHTVFNLLGVVIVLPFSRRLSDWLCNRFRTEEEVAGRPRHLDPNVLVTPALALNALVLETNRIGQHARSMAQAVLSAEHRSQMSLEAEHRVVAELVNAVGDFVTRLQRTSLPETVAEALPVVLRTGQYYLEVAETALAYGREPETPAGMCSDEVAEKVDAFIGEVANLIGRADPEAAGFSAAACVADAETIVTDYRRVKEALLAQTARARLNVSQLTDFLEQLRRVRRMADQAAKGAQYLDGLLTEVQRPAEMLAEKVREAEASEKAADAATVETSPEEGPEAPAAQEPGQTG
jgi:phosphate:Na+ symporter